MYLNWHEKDAYAIDIEADSLTPTIIWCMCWQNLKTGEKGECLSYSEIVSFFDRTRGSTYIGHNILKYDAPVLARLAGAPLGVGCIIDTLVLSTLYSPSIAGGHSLAAWGERLGKPKGDFTDFSHRTPEMVVYCHQDVSITAELFLRLIKTLTRIGFSERSIAIQHRFTVIIDRQHRNGFYFDGRRAIELFQNLRSIQEELEDQIRVAFPSKRVLVRDGQLFTKSGRNTSIYLRDCERFHIEYRDAESYQAYEDVPFNIGSPQQRVEQLTGLGWQPREFTPGGGAKPFDKGQLTPSLLEFLEDKNVPEVNLIARWMSVNGRANMVNTWLDAWNEDTNCIHGSLFVADTLRLKHSKPNTANIPGVRSDKSGNVLYGDGGYWTYEARDLWCARPKRVLVGTDAAGLELRMLAHYLNRADFTKQVVEGDPHQYNADMAGVSRPNAKTLIYAIQYGAQAGKVAQIMGCSKDEGAVVRQTFLDRLGLTDVMNGAINEQKNGRVSLLDGSLVVCPSPHAALNYKLQGSGARVMAAASIILEGYIRSDGLDSLKVGDIHDEWQYDLEPKDADQHAIRSVQAIREAGEHLGLNVPLDGTAKKGLTWAETH